MAILRTGSASRSLAAANVTPESAANKGQPNGYAGLDGSGKVPAGQLPSYVDDVVEYANLAAFPGTGETSKIYVALDTDKTYRWSGSTYIEISPSAVTSVAGKTGAVTLSSGDISGLATSATTDTTNASNISSGTLNAARLPSVNLGTTSVNLTRASGSLSLTGVSIDGSAGSVAWSGVSSKPTTISGYGITDAVSRTSSTGSAVLPVGTTAQRDSTPANGYIRYNNDVGRLEFFASSWLSVSVEGQFPACSLSWNESTDTYSNTSTVIDIQSRMRRCLLADNGTVNYYLDADDSTKKSGDWLRIVETQIISVDYTGTLSESANSGLRDGVPNWIAATYTRGQRVIHNNQLWECVAASTTATPAAGSVSSDLTGTDGQVMVEIPAFSVLYSYASNTHNWQIRRGVWTQAGWAVHPAFVKADGTYRPFLYIGAYQVTGTSPATTVSGVNNRVNVTRSALRSAAAARGSGWHQWGIYDLAAVQLLYLTEFQTFNSQRKLGRGAREGSTYQVNTGLSNAQGNRSQNANTGGGSVTDYVSYRGIENIYGRAFTWLDGYNWNGYSAYATNIYANFANDTSTGHTLVGTLPASGYQTQLAQIGTIFTPVAASGGSSTTYITDYLSSNASGWRSVYGGAYAGAANDLSGVFYYAAFADSGSSLASGRLAYGQT